MVHYIVLTEFETTGFTTCKLQDLPTTDLTIFEAKVSNLQKPYSIQEKYFEIDEMQGVKVINILAKNFGYRVTAQSMAIEKSVIGGRTTLIQKTVWTLFKE